MARDVPPPPAPPQSARHLNDELAPPSRGVFFEAAPSVIMEIDPDPVDYKPRAPRSGARVAPLPRPVIPLDLEDDVPHSGKSKGMLITVAVVVLLLAVGTWFWLGRGSDGKIPDPTSTTASPEQVQPAVVEKPTLVEQKVSKPDRIEKPARAEPRDEEPAEAPVKSVTKPPKEKPVVEAKPVKPAPPPEPDPADKKIDKVFLTSRPSGAKVTLDGRSMGKTPLEVEIRGKAAVSLSLDGYKTLEKELRLADVRGTVNFELQASSTAEAGSMGKLFLSSAPAGAEIVYQGKVIGKTPKMVELPAGNRTLILRSGALSHTVDLDLREGQNPAYHVPL